MSTKKQHFVPRIYMTAWKYKLKHLSKKKSEKELFPYNFWKNFVGGIDCLRCVKYSDRD